MHTSKEPWLKAIDLIRKPFVIFFLLLLGRIEKAEEVWSMIRVTGSQRARDVRPDTPPNNINLDWGRCNLWSVLHLWKISCRGFCIQHVLQDTLGQILASDLLPAFQHLIHSIHIEQLLPGNSTWNDDPSDLIRTRIWNVINGNISVLIYVVVYLGEDKPLLGRFIEKKNGQTKSRIM